MEEEALVVSVAMRAHSLSKYELGEIVTGAAALISQADSDLITYREALVIAAGRGEIEESLAIELIVRLTSTNTP